MASRRAPSEAGTARPAEGGGSPGGGKPSLSDARAGKGSGSPSASPGEAQRQVNAGKKRANFKASV